jgi:hypothetical protein
LRRHRASQNPADSFKHVVPPTSAAMAATRRS